jgi:hypothetical protein
MPKEKREKGGYRRKTNKTYPRPPEEQFVIGLSAAASESNNKTAKQFPKRNTNKTLIGTCQGASVLRDRRFPTLPWLQSSFFFLGFAILIQASVFKNMSSLSIGYMELKYLGLGFKMSSQI